MKQFYKYKSLKQYANAFVRNEGYGSLATKLTPTDKMETSIGEYTQYGYRKRSDNTYVSNAYRANFGWKNTYYQHAVVEVLLPLEVYVYFGWGI